MFGFLNIYKPIGITSFDVIRVLKKVLNTKHIGHAGTLDPFAQGVLPIAIGKATRLIEFLGNEKEYLAEVSFGKSTNTYDCDGETVSTSNKKISLKYIQTCLKDFEGEILQTPPIFSAIKVKGKKLYEYARAGENVEIKPRKVFVEKIEIKSFDEIHQKAEILIKCSKGTYIRSIANDLGEKLECGAHLSKLIRTQSAKFLSNNSVKLDEITSDNVKSFLINPLEVIDLQSIELDENEHNKILMGQPIFNKKNIQDDFVLLVYNNSVSAIAKVDKDCLKVKKVFDEKV